MSDGLWPTDIARLYRLDLRQDAVGQCVGIIAMGGGYDPNDLIAAADAMKRPHATVVDCPVDGNSFGSDPRSDEELALDLQVVASLVPGARIVVYFTTNDAQGLGDAISQAIADKVNQPKVLSISWGSAEINWETEFRDFVESALADGARAGITVLAASGDFLACGGLTDGLPHVFFPASSSLVLACGGTQMTLDDQSAFKSEAVWNDGSTGSGGGVSDVIALPDYQKSASIPKSKDGQARRGIPDVAAAAGNPGYRIIVKNKPKAMRGTSAAAPFWAALVAMANARRGVPAGPIHDFLYATPTIYRQILAGDNRLDGVGYFAGPGWNPCTGLGVPNDRTVDGLVGIPLDQIRDRRPAIPESIAVAVMVANRHTCCFCRVDGKHCASLVRRHRPSAEGVRAREAFAQPALRRSPVVGRNEQAEHFRQTAPLGRSVE